jgi:hypothetical protein
MIYDGSSVFDLLSILAFVQHLSGSWAWGWNRGTEFVASKIQYDILQHRRAMLEGYGKASYLLFSVYLTLYLTVFVFSCITSSASLSCWSVRNIVSAILTAQSFHHPSNLSSWSWSGSAFISSSAQLFTMLPKSLNITTSISHTFFNFFINLQSHPYPKTI